MEFVCGYYYRVAEDGGHRWGGSMEIMLDGHSQNSDGLELNLFSL